MRKCIIETQFRVLVEKEKSNRIGLNRPAQLTLEKKGRTANKRNQSERERELYYRVGLRNSCDLWEQRRHLPLGSVHRGG